MKRTFFLLALGLNTIMACKSTTNLSTKETDQALVAKATVQPAEVLIETNRWELTSFMGKTPVDAGFVNRIPNVIINMAQGRMGGNNGCNSFSGDITITETTLSKGLFMATKMYCDGVPEIEFFNLLEGTLNYSINNEVLSLSKEGEVVMTFRLMEPIE